eukprot:scaffold99873_cov33-Attheya_sp.AAC.3
MSDPQSIRSSYFQPLESMSISTVSTSVPPSTNSSMKHTRSNDSGHTSTSISNGPRPPAN